MMRNKKAAMFGLDARIALAIFGALSVISGAALYKVMDEIKATRYHYFLEGIVGASEAYYLDNGKPLPQIETDNYTHYIIDLFENRQNLSTWKGPYFNGIAKVTNDTYFMFNKDIFGISPWGSIHSYKNSSWASVPDYAAVNDINSGEWIAVAADTDAELEWAQDVFRLLDKKLDNNDGMLAGKVRYKIIDATHHNLYYQGRQRIRTPQP
jgi:type II secretory pathway pseudopilin PulG